MLRKARKCAEGDTRIIEKSSEKNKLQSITSFRRLMLSDKEGINVDKRKTQKRSDMTGTRCNSARTKGEIKGKLEEAIEKWKECEVKIKERK